MARIRPTSGSRSARLLGAIRVALIILTIVVTLWSGWYEAGYRFRFGQSFWAVYLDRGFFRLAKDDFISMHRLGLLDARRDCERRLAMMAPVRRAAAKLTRNHAAQHAGFRNMAALR